jgi:predicted metalloenzyme YecM
MKNKHSNQITNFEQTIIQLKKTININMDQCDKDTKLLKTELEESKSTLNKKLDTCFEKNGELKN